MYNNTSRNFIAQKKQTVHSWPCKSKSTLVCTHSHSSVDQEMFPTLMNIFTYLMLRKSKALLVRAVISAAIHGQHPGAFVWPFTITWGVCAGVYKWVF